MVKKIWFIIISCFAIQVSVGCCYSTMAKNTVVKFNSESMTSGIQEAIDSLPDEGGVIFLPAGVYLLRKPVILRSNIILEGEGQYSILTTKKPLVTPLTETAKIGDTIFFVENTNKFRKGDTISLYDQKMKGWYTFTTTIADILDDHRIKVTHQITPQHKKQLPFKPKRKAVVTNTFPLLRTNLLPSDDSKYNITIKNIYIKFPKQEKIIVPYNFVLSAIHIVNTYNITIRNCQIIYSFHDGISIQSGGDISISDCKVQNCNGHGFHPGTGMKRGIIYHNFSINNKLDGLYFCCRVHELIISNNILNGNNGFGIGGLGAGCGGSDSFNIVNNNIISNNGKYGIQLIKGKNNIITSNVIYQNVEGQIECIDTTRTIIIQNCCRGEKKCIVLKNIDKNTNKIIDNICEISEQKSN